MTGEEMPVWRPPTPPCDDKEGVYVDQVQDYIYEATPLPEVQLPRHTRTRRYLGDYKKHGKRSTSSFRLPYKDSVRRRLRKPHSMFDRRALEAFFKNRRNALSNAKKAKMKMTKQQQQQPQQQHTASVAMRQQGDMQMVDTGPEWFVHEEWALLQAVHYLQEMPIDLTVTDLGHTPNWLLVSDIVNATSRTYRTARQCRDRYVNVVMLREEGKVPLIDDSQKKMKTKLKASYASTEYSAVAGNQPLPKPKDGQGTRMHGIQTHDGNRSSTLHHSSLFELVKKTSVKRKPSVKQSLSTEPYQKSAGQSSSTAGVKVEDVYLDPARIAAMKMERIQREKAEALTRQQQQQQQQQQSTQEQQPQQQTQQPAHALSQHPATAVTKVTVSLAQQPSQLTAAGQQPSQAVPGYQTQRLAAHSQILTSTNPKITTAQLAATLTTKPTANIQGTTALQGTLVKGAAGSSIVVKTPPGNVTGHFAAINKRMAAHSGTPTTTLPTMKAVVTSEGGNRAIPTHETAVQFLASAANGTIRLSNATLAPSNSVVVSQAQAGQRLPDSVAKIIPGKPFVRTGTTKTTITAQQYHNLIQQQQQQQQQRRQQQGQQPQTQGKQVVQPAARKVASPAPQKHLPVGTKVDQQRLTQTMTVTRPVQQQQLQQATTQRTQQQLQQIVQQKQQQPKLVQQPQQKPAAIQQQPKQAIKQEKQVVAHQVTTQQLPTATQQIKRVQLASGQQVTAVTQAGIVTTSGVGGTAKHVVKLLPGQTIQSLVKSSQKFTSQQVYHMSLIKQQQRLQQSQQQQPQQQSQQQSQQRQTSTPSSLAQPSTSTVEVAPNAASPGVQSQLQPTPTTQIQLVKLQQPGLVSNTTMQPKQPVTKPAAIIAGQQITSPSATPISTGQTVSTVVATTPTSTQVAQSANTTGQHQSPYAMRSRSQSK